MYPLYTILPRDICEIIRNILLSRFTDAKILQYTHGFKYILSKYNDYFNKYQISTIFNVSNIFMDIDHICRNISHLYIRCLYKYNIPNNILPQEFITTKHDLSVWCTILINKIQQERFIINRYTNIINITKKKVEVVLHHIK